jgi:hypothetical protein
MDNIRCPRCLYHSQYDNAPLGKEPRKYNPTGDVAIYDDCYACSGTGYVQPVVINEIRRCFPDRADSIFANLKWGGDHFYFMLGNIYVGCEVKDGYCHS